MKDRAGSAWCARFAGVTAVVMCLVCFGLNGRASAVAVPYVWNFGSPPAQGPSIAELQSTYDGQIQVGDKLFTFPVDAVTTSATVGTVAPTAAAIVVAGVYIGGDYGLRFNGGWSAGGQQIADTTLLFKVEVTEPEKSAGILIKDNSLWISAFGISGTGQGGIVSVSENVYAQNPRLFPPNVNAPIANKYVYYRSIADQQLYDHQNFADLSGPVTLSQIWVLKDVVANGGALTTGSAHLSEFYQTFSQTPEPATVAMLAFGGLGLVGAARRRRRAR